ncbi:MAG: hypothetical protein GQ477_01035 [Nanohaloarchaea archaeon]|nr:hypothetical protein [Candidatus Nanohaloarchaea archaeon]
MASHKFYFYVITSFILVSIISVISAVPEPTVDVLIRLESQTFNPYEDMSDNYVVSDISQDTVTALVHAAGTFNGVSSDSDNIDLNASINSKTYLVYTKGDRNTIDSRIPTIISDNFDTVPNPSFGFPLSKKNKIVVSLEYENMDVVSSETFGAGFHDMIIENVGADGNRYLLDIKSK